MTRPSTISLPIVTSADGTRCMEACPQMSGAWPWTCSHWWDPITGAATLDDVDVDAGTARRPPACIAAEQVRCMTAWCQAHGLDYMTAVRDALARVVEGDG